MNEEKNNIGINNTGGSNGNSLPPMGTAQLNTNNVHDKYGLPPISNFTNFNVNYEPPKVDNNISVFDLMDQFESVNSGNVPPMPKKNTVNSSTITNNVGASNIQTVDTEPLQVQKPSISSIPTTNPSLNQNIINNNTNPVASFNMFSGNNTISNETSIPVINKGLESNTTIPTNNLNNVNITSQSNEKDSLGIFSGSITNTKANISNNVENVQSINSNNINTTIPNSNLNNANVMNQTNENNPLSIFGGSVNNTLENNGSINNNIQIPDENYNTDFNQELGSENSKQISNVSDTTIPNISGVNNSAHEMSTINPQNNIALDSINNVSSMEQVIPTGDASQEINSFDSDISNFSQNTEIDNNRAVEIPTTSIDNIDNSNQNNDLITNFNSADKINIDTNNVVTNTNNTASSNVNENVKPKKKGHKVLFVILLLITIIIVGAVGVLSYFMFFKTDKLVCGYQDYSNEQYMLDESMVIRFKGNKMTDAKLTQSLTFTEDNLDKKDSYLEELKNQYQGLGFNVSFVDNENGFEIDMDFTKSELESWYGTSLKNSSKTQMKKELRDSGYTCK